MTKELEKHIKDIMASRTSFMAEADGASCVTDKYRMLVLPDPSDAPEGLLPRPSKDLRVKKTVSEILSFDSDSILKYEAFSLPDAREMKKGIADLAGRNRKLRVCWSSESAGVTLNARWLLDAMTALRARKAYRTGAGSLYPVILYAGDDPSSRQKEYIWEVYNSAGMKGFYLADD